MPPYSMCRHTIGQRRVSLRLLACIDVLLQSEEHKLGHSRLPCTFNLSLGASTCALQAGRFAAEGGRTTRPKPQDCGCGRSSEGVSRAVGCTSAPLRCV